MLTARKRVRPLPTHRLALRYSVDYSSSDHFTSKDSSRDSSSETSSDSHLDTSYDSPSRHSSSGHSISDSLCDSPTAISVGPSRKRRRSPTTSVPAASLVPRALSPVRADLLLPRRRIRDFDFVTDFEVKSEEGFVTYVPRDIGLRVDFQDSYKPYTEPDIDPNVQTDIDACIAFADDIAARGTDVGVEDGTAAEEEAESSTRGMMEIGVDRVTHPVVSDDTAEPFIGSELSRVSRETRDIGLWRLASRALLCQRGLVRWSGTMPTATHSEMTQDVINELISKRVAESLEAKELMKLITEVYCPRNEIHKMETKLWNLTVKEEEDQVEKYIRGLPNKIQGNVIVVKPTRLQDAICIANNLLDQKLKGYAANNAENKRRFDNNLRDNRGQQQPFKRQNVNGQNVARAYIVRNVERKGFDVIIGMDWLSKYYAVIVCDEKIICIPYGDEVLIIESDGCNSGSKSKLSIKTQKYIQKGCQFYLAQVTAKKTDDKSEEKRLEDVPIVQDFLKVFPEDLP
ncbi:hypothetical protein Tco_0245354 [Tanacetum coccineum]